MTNKKSIQSFLKKENEIKVSLLSEIKVKFESYKSNTVVFYPVLEDEEIKGYYELETLIHDVCPQIKNGIGQIDATALPHSICYEDGVLVLKVEGNTSTPDTDYITLEEPTYGLTVNGLYNLLLLIKHPSVKKLNKTMSK